MIFFIQVLYRFIKINNIKERKEINIKEPNAVNNFLKIKCQTSEIKVQKIDPIFFPHHSKKNWTFQNTLNNFFCRDSKSVEGGGL